MKTEFAKAIEAGEDVVGKEVVLLKQDGYRVLQQGKVYTVDAVYRDAFMVDEWVVGGYLLFAPNTVNDFEFKHVLDKQEEESVAYKLLSEQNKLLEVMLEGAKVRNKQYEQQIQMLKDDLFNLQMENARLDLAAQRWQMFDCEANRNIADKLLKKLADEQGV